MAKDQDCSTTLMQADNHTAKGIRLAERGWLDESVNEFRKAIDLDPDCSQHHDNLAMVYADKGNLLDALRHYLRAVELEPENAALHHNLGCFLFSHADEIAITAYRDSAELDWDQPDLHYNFGLALVEQGKLQEAVNEFKVALVQNPADNAARSELASALMDLGQHREAIQELKRVVKEDDTNQPAHVDLGICYMTKGFYAQAEKAYQRALALDPNDVLAIYHLSALRALQKQNKDALQLLQKAATLDRAHVMKWLKHDEYFADLVEMNTFKEIIG